ncbi:hypothetical protein EHS89_14640 [Amphritea balenae]|uniref:MACPF domain-containing protein n=2 Tax=Amphritea balenae TaxID=452629 RepID=A0A3P1SN07_9GAMM|nr:hypothetical protein [Amphritea balenae]RRC98324.1 hypothetical protein EHS89_14640 [Amphritea balenae]GGK80959.1 hypothetical protein GCM10007941_34220 [Amphritea balenae]
MLSEATTLQEQPSVPDFNNYTISRDQYQVDPGFISEGKLNPGDGVDMSDPGAPQRRIGRQPLNVLGPKRLAGVPTKDYTLTESFRLVESTSVREEANTLAAYFQGAYGFASADAAYEQARQERKSSHSIYAVLDAKGVVRDLSDVVPNGRIEWNESSKPHYEGGGASASDPDFRRQFLLDFGSHYISAVTYGYRIAVRGKITEADSSKSSEIKAAFKATFVSGSAAGGITDQNRQILSNSKLELMFVASSGGLYVDDERRPGVLTNLDDILTMLKDMRDGKIKIHSAPIQATARNYWNLLPIAYTRSRALLADHGLPPLPENVYGVPKGTVLAWRPTEANLKTDNAGSSYLLAPQGWALCNGEEGTPDLRDRFILGGKAFDEVGVVGGAVSHTHTATSIKTKSTWQARPGVGSKYSQPKPEHTHAISVGKSNNLPPFVKLAYIMKL